MLDAKPDAQPRDDEPECHQRQPGTDPGEQGPLVRLKDAKVRRSIWHL
jgi:hypothetical protein